MSQLKLQNVKHLISPDSICVFTLMTLILFYCQKKVERLIYVQWKVSKLNYEWNKIVVFCIAARSELSLLKKLFIPNSQKYISLCLSVYLFISIYLSYSAKWTFQILMLSISFSATKKKNRSLGRDGKWGRAIGGGVISSLFCSVCLFVLFVCLFCLFACSVCLLVLFVCLFCLFALNLFLFF